MKSYSSPVSRGITCILDDSTPHDLCPLPMLNVNAGNIVHLGREAETEVVELSGTSDI